jgi:hypothetical protein
MVKFGLGDPKDHILTVLSRQEEAKVLGSLGFTAIFIM